MLTPSIYPLKSVKTQLFFGRRLADKRQFEEANRIISGLIGKAPAVLLTTTLLDLIPGEAPPRCALIPLENVLQVFPNQTSIDEGPVYAALRGSDHRFHSGGIGFAFSPGFRSGVFGDQEYSFTDKQALVVEALYEAWKNGIPGSIRPKSKARPVRTNVSASCFPATRLTARLLNMTAQAITG